MIKRLCLITSLLIFILGICLGELPQAIGESTYDLKEITPAIQKALENRKGRYDQLRAFKDLGIIGENNRGYVELLKDNKEAKALAEAENKDRQLIYSSIVEQNQLPQESLATIEKVFAQVQREKANKGDQVQDENGQWVSK